MEEGYGGANNMGDLRQFITRASQFNVPPPPPPYQPHPQAPPQDHQFNLFHHHHLQPQQQQLYEVVLMGGRHVIPPQPSIGLHHHGGGSGEHVLHHRCDSSTSTPTANPAGGVSTGTPTTMMIGGNSGDGFDVEAGGSVGGGGFIGFGVGLGGGGDAGGSGTARWPRQETLTLLEIRSRLDHKFKEANQKGPLWEEVSRIMYEEHGYQRSGKKCREKFENLYKYYKKTKEGKAGRQDGKHYRFFRQLEALYGDHTSTSSQTTFLPAVGAASSSDIHTSSRNNYSATLDFHQHHHMAAAAAAGGGPIFPITTGQNINDNLIQSISLSNSSSEFHTSSSSEDLNDDNNGEGSMENNGTSSLDVMMTKRRRRRGGGGGGKRSSWKVKVKEFINAQMRKIVEKQESWLERMTRTLERKEQERVMREEEWRRKEAERMEMDRKQWATERAWIEARDKALMAALQRLNGNQQDKEDEPNLPANRDHQQQHHTEELLLMMSNAYQKPPGQQEDNNQNQQDQEGTSGGGISSNDGHRHHHRWVESEIRELMQLRSSMEMRFEQCNGGGGLEEEESLWEDIARRLACLGYDRTANMCKQKWEDYYSSSSKNNNRKDHQSWMRIGSSIDCNNTIHGHQTLRNEDTTMPSLCSNYGGGGVSSAGLQQPLEVQQGGVNPMNDGCFRFLLGDHGENQLWENYGLKLNKGDQTHHHHHHQ